MSLFINSAVGAYIEIGSLKKAYEICNNLEHLVKKEGYYLWVYDNHKNGVLMFGKRGKFTIQGLPVGLFMNQEEWKNYICPPADLFNFEEKREAEKEFEKFLESLPKKYKLLKYVKWSDVDVYLNTFT